MSSAIPTKGMVRPEFVCASTRPLARSHADARLEAGVRSRAPRGGKVDRGTASTQAASATLYSGTSKRTASLVTRHLLDHHDRGELAVGGMGGGIGPCSAGVPAAARPPAGGRTCPWQTGCWAPRVSRRRSRSDTAVWQMGVNSGQWRSRAVRRKPSSWPHSGWFRRWRTASRPIGGVLYPGRARTVTIHLRGLPGDIGRAARPTLGLAPGGACRADRIAPVAGALLPHRFTLA